ncbi:MAG: hypothetical protein J5I52_01760 [Saprospiraceae bacterium]|nr:MAG: hypothetical protein UZ09_BCD002000166 [Bacteroidetes bacterium OLB9]MCO6462853.1 hypothetical protein [Saprospiraceae bacterium]MCZ2338681.1 hypothetical protein [Chitinophagales bacterium]
MQNQEYPRYLYRMLMDYGRVYIPDVGVFTLEYHEAANGETIFNLKPPLTKLNFNKSDEGKPDFATLLHDSGMPEDHAQYIQASFQQDYQASIEKNQPFVINGLGKIINQIFLPDDEQIFNKYRGLNDIHTQPIMVASKEVKHDEDYLYRLNQQNARKKKSWLNEYFWAIPISLIVLTAIILWLLSNDIRTIKHTPKQVAQQNPPEMVEVLPAEDTITDDDMPPSVVQDTFIIEPNEPQKPSASEPTVVQPVIRPDASAPTTDCAIILGVFKYHKNATRMKRDITKRGYESFIMDHNGMRRVGIRYNCDTTNAEAFKEKIRQEFNKDAWILE